MKRTRQQVIDDDGGGDGGETSARLCQLGNFARTPIRVRCRDLPRKVRAAFPAWARWVGQQGVVFPSVEHAWQSLRAKRRSVFDIFTQERGVLRCFSLGIARQLFPYRRTSHSLCADTYAMGRMIGWRDSDAVGALAYFLWRRCEHGKETAIPALQLARGDLADHTHETEDPSVARAALGTLLKIKFRQHPRLFELLCKRDDAVDALARVDRARAPYSREGQYERFSACLLEVRAYLLYRRKPK